MPNELVRQSNGEQKPEWPNALGYGADTTDEWDLPPEQMGYGPRLSANPQPVHDAGIRRAAALADQDAAQARARGDGEFAGVRESDAGDLRQSAWDWGDLKTWLWLGGMCLVFLLTVALCYFLPYGRHASPPPIRVY